MKYSVIGFAKCGTVSLQKYLTNKGHDATKNEHPVYWTKEKQDDFLKDRQPIVITRDRAETLWSFYQYFGYDKLKLPYEEFFTLKIKANNFLNLTPIEIYDYDRWILPNYEVIRYEELIKDPEFPHENKTRNKTEIPYQFKDAVRRLYITNTHLA